MTPTPSELTIAAVSGLCNRMRVTASVWAAAPKMERSIHLVWQPAWNCRAKFSDLFEPVAVEGVRLDEGSFLDTPATKDNVLLPMLLRKLRNSKEWRCFRPSPQFSFDDFPTNRPVYIDTCYALGAYEPAQHMALFKPLPRWKGQIDEWASKFPAHTLGVHIRRTDNLQAIRMSPLRSFIERINSLIECGEAEKIFLSTDDENVRTHLQKVYGSRLLSRKVCLDRNRAAAIGDAVVDLFVLSRCNRLLGSYYSSFSDTAAELCGTPLEIIQAPQ